MDKEAARHALTMDQVLMSVKKTFADEPTPARVLATKRKSGTMPLPDSVRAQQRRLKTIQTRRRELPDPPAALLARGGQGSRPPLPEVVLRRRVQAEVPGSVEVNAVRERAATAAARARAHVAGQSASEAVVPVPAKSRIEPAARWGNRRARQAQAVTAEQTVFGPMPETIPADADWDSLKSGLRMVLDEWVERQKAGSTDGS